MALSESSNPAQANSLVSFLDTASKTINGLMDKSPKGSKRKVNHKKYLQKRLQKKPSQPKAAKPTKSKSALLPSAASARAPAASASGVPPPIVHHNSWPQLSGYSQQPPVPVESDIDFLLQQLSSTASEMPVVTRPSSESSFYHHMRTPQPAVSLENQVLIGEQPYGSPYTPSNSSVDEFLDDSAYSSPSSSIHSSPATVSLAPCDWNPPPITASMPVVCLPTTTSECWGVPHHPPSCLTLSSDWLTTSPPISSVSTMDQHLPTVPQLWDQLSYCEQVRY